MIRKTICQLWEAELDSLPRAWQKLQKQWAHFQGANMNLIIERLLDVGELKKFVSLHPFYDPWISSTFRYF